MRRKRLKEAIVPDKLNGIEVSVDPDSNYADTHYLLFGFSDPSGYEACFDCVSAKDYLGKMGFSDGALTQTRKQRGRCNKYLGCVEAGERYCDFCGMLLSGVEYERLKDGRDRCIECSRSVLKGAKDFEALFVQTKEGLCEKFGIDIPAPVKVQVVSQAKLSRALGKKFVPTPGFDARAVGLAVSNRGHYRMLFENGSPRISLLSTAAHELTHIWQYTHWDMGMMKSKYGSRYLAVVEGMAVWSELQYLFLLNETSVAERKLERDVMRNDEYGYGLRLYLNQYPLSKGISLDGDTPFAHVDEPLER